MTTRAARLVRRGGGVSRMMPRGIARGAAVLGLCLVVALGGCETISDIFGDSDEERLSGERLS